MYACLCIGTVIVASRMKSICTFLLSMSNPAATSLKNARAFSVFSALAAGAGANTMSARGCSPHAGIGELLL